MRIAFTHNLKTSEDEEQAEFDSPETVATIADLLRELGHEVHPVDVSGPVSRLVARLETLRPDLVFNTAEGTRGRYREAFYPALFEQLDLPFTGSGPHVCALTLDKQATKLLVAQAGVPTPKWLFFDAERPWKGELGELRFPVIIKPNFEGSSKGVTADSVVHDMPNLERVLTDMLKRYPSGALIEEFIIGDDVTVPFLEVGGVLEAASYKLHVEGMKPGHAIYDYDLKNTNSHLVDVNVPAHLPEQTRAALRAHTDTIRRTLDIRDLGRADFRVTKDGEIAFIEVNALPSLEPGASLYVCAAHAGFGQETQVLERVIQSAMLRQNLTERPARSARALHIGLAHNLRRVDPKSGDVDAEFDSPTTVHAIAAAIESLGHEVTLLEATPDLARVLGEYELDVVFNIAEGLRGRSREAQIPALLDLLGIEHTGSDTAALSVTLDKGLAKRLVREAGVATAAWHLVQPGQPIPTTLRFPVIAKPNAEGSSKGVSATSVARDAVQLLTITQELHARYGSGVLVEEFLTGREFTVGLLGERDPQVLPVMEIVFDESVGELPIYSYEHKTEVEAGVSFVVPAAIDDALRARLSEVATTCFEALGCRDVARIDLRLDAAGEPHFIECNPLPGLTPGFSDLCVIALAAGMDHGALIAAILAPALRRLEQARAGSTS